MSLIYEANVNQLKDYLKERIAELEKWQNNPAKYHKLADVCLTQEIVYRDALSQLENIFALNNGKETKSETSQSSTKGEKSL